MTTFKEGTNALIKKMLLEEIQTAQEVNPETTDKYGVKEIQVTAKNGKKIFFNYGFQNSSGFSVDVQDDSLTAHNHRRHVYGGEFGEIEEWKKALNTRREDIKSENSNDEAVQNLAFIQELFGKEK